MIKNPLISNPITDIYSKFSFLKNKYNRKFIVRDDSLKLNMSDYQAVSIWVSNPAILWTADRAEEEGIHVHCYNNDKKVIDDTYGKLIINGDTIDYEMAKIYFAQCNLKYLDNRVVSLFCPHCNKPHFDIEKAYTPHIEHICDYCHTTFKSRNGIKKVVSNPLKSILTSLKNNL